MTISKQVTNKKEAKAILSKIYEADKQGGYCNNGMGFSGSVLTAIANKNEEGYVVEISSGYYTQSSIEQIIKETQTKQHTKAIPGKMYSYTGRYYTREEAKAAAIKASTNKHTYYTRIVEKGNTYYDVRIENI